ncbi:MAG: DUF3817 domain-containing protein [Myxococcales bacterium]|nr:DUF3817 domain-containing protein [Myxococcales bacterium]
MRSVQTLRALGIIEGLSFLLLLFVAMPLKYAFAMPLAVRVAGMAHGVLFVGLVIALARVHVERDWTMRTSALVFLAALVPFGFLFIDRRLREEAAACATP